MKVECIEMHRHVTDQFMERNDDDNWEIIEYWEIVELLLTKENNKEFSTKLVEPSELFHS